MKGIKIFSVEKVLCHSAENCRRGTLLCFNKYLVWKLFIQRRGGGITVFSKEVYFQRAETKILVVEHSSFRESFWNRKFLCMRRDYHDFLPECFYLTVPKNFLGETFCVSKKSGIERLVAEGREGVTVLSSFFLSHRIENYPMGSLLCFRNFLVRKKVWKRCRGAGEVSWFSIEHFSSQSAENFVGDPFNVSQNLGCRWTLCIRRDITFFSLERFFPTVPRKIVEEHFCVSRKSGFEFFLA